MVAKRATVIVRGLRRSGRRPAEAAERICCSKFCKTAALRDGEVKGGSDVEFIDNILTDSDCYRAAQPLTPTGIVVHSTGVDPKRIAAYTAQWNRPGVRACVHGLLGLDGDGRLCFARTLPYELRCWGCGSGPKGSYNDSCIQFEICETLDDGAWCRETYAAALELCAGLCLAYGIAPEKVVCHSEAHALGYASNHGDVMHWWPRWGLSMAGFRAELAARLCAPASQRRYRTLDELPESLRQEAAALADAGVLRGRGESAGLDVTEDMLRAMIISKRYTDLRRSAAG